MTSEIRDYTDQNWDSDDPGPLGNEPFDDSCPDCRSDWKQPHAPECSRFRQCQYPPGCKADSAAARKLCLPHWYLIGAMFGETKVSSENIAWANAQLAKREQS